MRSCAYTCQFGASRRSRQALTLLGNGRKNSGSLFLHGCNWQPLCHFPCPNPRKFSNVSVLSTAQPSRARNSPLCARCRLVHPSVARKYGSLKQCFTRASVWNRECIREDRGDERSRGRALRFAELFARRYERIPRISVKQAFPIELSR